MRRLFGGKRNGVWSRHKRAAMSTASRGNPICSACVGKPLLQNVVLLLLHLIVGCNSRPPPDSGDYYYFEPNYTCRANAPDLPQIKSWKNRLEIKEGLVYEWQSLCNDNAIVHNFDYSVFQFSDDNSILFYNSHKFHLYKETPRLCEKGKGVWCPVGSSNP